VRRLDARPFVARCAALLERHRWEPPARYARWTLPGRDGARPGGPNPYGIADAANVLYTLGRLPGAPEERAAWVATLRELQDPTTGWFFEPTHDRLHTTAHCLAALELFDARPLHPIPGLAPLADTVEAFLEGLDWRAHPWTESHRGAGLYAALHLADAEPPGFADRYFAWLAGTCDPGSGLWRKGALPAGPDRARWCFPHLAGTFHYLFNHEHARRPHPHPAPLVDTCLAALAAGAFPLGRSVGFAEIDWVYCLHRAARQSGHRLAEARAALRVFAADYLAWLDALDPATDPGLDDLHGLFGALCAVAELQAALPGEIVTERPLRLVLDRRPFI
jgi:hypothetical protein